MADTHRMLVAWICGKPFGIPQHEHKTVASLLELSAKLPALMVTPDGLATMATTADTMALENQIFSRLELADVICTDCADGDNRADDATQPPRELLGRALISILSRGE